MTSIQIDLRGAQLPKADGDVVTYVHAEASRSPRHFDRARRALFVNGMGNTPVDHARSALALSLVQMCTVVGVYNMSSSFFADLAQCLADKNQFNGPLSLSAAHRASFHRLVTPQVPAERAIRAALARNPAAATLFDLLRSPLHKRSQVFAHSQGNLIVSNALQAIAAVDGPAAIQGRVVYSFGSPSVSWPSGIRHQEFGFTWDPVTWLAGVDKSLSIAKVGMPNGSLQPITHSFLEYLDSDPEFVVNRFRVGGLGLTLAMDEAGLAQCLLAMETNLRRVHRVFDLLARRHPSDADDVALLYVQGLHGHAQAARIKAALKEERELVALLVKVLDDGWTTADEKAAIQTLQRL